MHPPLFFRAVSAISLVISSVAAGPIDVTTRAKANPKALLVCVKDALGPDNIGQIITPSDDQYLTARSGAVLVDQFPALVVYPKKIDDLSPLVKCGVKNGFKISPRTGSHHFENWGSLTGSLVIDISNINYILPSQDLKTATVGAGVKLGALYSVLGSYGTSFSAAICPTVGLGGHISVGGYNMQMRTEGLAGDHLESAKVVLANGTMVDVSETSNPDLWYAMRGGGTYGLTAEVVIKTTDIPRSAMFSMDFDSSSRLEVLQIFQNWASRQDPFFNSQLNLWSDRTNVLGWYLGKSKEELTDLVATSGFMDIPGGNIKISGDCSPSNSRNMWLSLQDTCTDDATADEIFNMMNNMAPDSLELVQPNGLANVLSQTPALPDVPRASRWTRANITGKTFFELKDKPLSDEDVKWLIDETAKLPPSAGFWAEITTFNVSSPETTSAFAWQGQAKTLWRLQVNKGIDNATVQAQADAFIESIETYLRPRIGNANYAGYVDKDVSGDPYEAYYGDSVCRLVSARKQYDPEHTFYNPFSIGPKAPKGYTC